MTSKKTRKMTKVRRDAPLSNTHRTRLSVARWGFIAVFTVIIIRLFALQIQPDWKLSEEDLIHIGNAEYKIPRGKIFDADGRVLATDKRVSSLCANPSAIKSPELVASSLSNLLDIDEKEMTACLTKIDSNNNKLKFVWVKRWLSDEQEQRLVAFQKADWWKGLWLLDEKVRYYPEGELAAHIMGFADRDGAGKEGIERSFDKYLRSFPGKREARKDRKGNFLPSLTIEFVPPSGGDSVHLTIDSSIQHSLERQLDERLKTAKAPSGVGVIINPKTGAILAMASRPAFDPNKYWDYDAALRKNRAIIDVFEPGSAFKILTAAAVLERKLVTRDTIIDCEEGSFRPYGRRIIHDFHSLGEEPFWNCFTQSSNIAMVKVSALLGEEQMAGWITRFGFGQRTCSDFSGESVGIVHPLSKWSGYSLASLSMGQEISVTALQLARAFGVIANGGFLVEPYIVEKAIAVDGTTSYQHQATAPKRILSAETASIMKDLCHLVVNSEDGTGTVASIKEFRVGGKTGTAQIAHSDKKGYGAKYTAVFAGFAPVADPQICAVIVIQEPGIRQHYGGYVCGPVFKEVVRQALIRMKCPRDPVVEVAESGKEQFEVDPDTVTARLELDLIEPLEENFVALLDSLDLVAFAGASIPGKNSLPDFTGMTKQQAKEKISSMGLRWDVRGAGWVASQEPPPGTPLEKVSLCRLVFSNKSGQT